MKQNGNKIIVGIKILAKYLNVSEPTVYEYIKEGMPGDKICGRWHFHIDNIELFFKTRTAKSFKNAPIDFIMEEKIYKPENTGQVKKS